MFALDNISVREFYLTEDVSGYMELQKLMNPKPCFGKLKAKSLMELPFGDVSKIKRVVLNPTYEGLLEAFQLVFGVRRYQYESASIVDYFYALNHLMSETKQLVEREVKMLSSEPDPMLVLAGVEKLNKYKELNTLIDLGQKFGKSPKEVERWSYATVFSLALHGKDSSEIEKRYHELKIRKNGHK